MKVVNINNYLNEAKSITSLCVYAGTSMALTALSNEAAELIRRECAAYAFSFVPGIEGYPSNNNRYQATNISLNNDLNCQRFWRDFFKTGSAIYLGLFVIFSVSLAIKIIGKYRNPALQAVHPHAQAGINKLFYPAAAAGLTAAGLAVNTGVIYGDKMSKAFNKAVFCPQGMLGEYRCSLILYTIGCVALCSGVALGIVYVAMRRFLGDPAGQFEPLPALEPDPPPLDPGNHHPPVTIRRLKLKQDSFLLR